MFRVCRAAFVAVGLLACVPAPAADEAYVLKLYKSKPGDKTEHEESEAGKTTVVFSVGGMEKKETISSGEKQVYTQEILEKKAGDRRPSKLTRTYSAVEKTERGETTRAGYVGKPVLIERKAGGYAISVMGKLLAKDEAPDLYKKFDVKKDDEPQNQDFVPTEPVKVGGIWKVPAAASEKMFKTLDQDKMKIDVKKSSIGGKLLKVYEKGGARYGVLELDFTLFISEIDLDGQLVATTEGSKMALKVTADVCIDGTVPFEDNKVDINMDVSAEIPNGSITFKVAAKGVEKVNAAKK